MVEGSNLSTKEKILKVSEQVFAEKGFDGARVDEIARKAGVNKALIYYYFDGKDDLLDHLFNLLIDEVRNFIVEEVKDLNLDDDEAFNKVFNNTLNLLETKRDILKVAFIESLKGDTKHSIIFNLGEIIMGSEIERITEVFTSMGLEVPEDKQYMLVGEFFTGILPMIGFVIFKDNFSNYFGTDPDKIKDHFKKVFKKSHLGFHDLSK
ncbi:TetR/AcrR family transcriptional regulator [Halothermothrix orenii]|uniref:Transcriptional regulator, TetR family n=1 Tax=Halothermothrix orenii (strain H 168 / OCM 544 / DSM 9562) TaxID=373903 RepID=B8CY50_HALOH|nr:TetR/AcrR family transcriptional regulator [Halothermothrix orenii]ACL70219.1 transcriptional regulator, TetR family [Halothermothrix orenii H 168]